MGMTKAQDHWESAWNRGSAESKSWFQGESRLSLELIANSQMDKSAGLIDVGSGASRLVDQLLQQGYSDLTVLDISHAALEISRGRLGERAEQVHWIEQDVTRFRPGRQWALWHDRAVFHFMIEAKQREAYKRALREGLAPGGTLVLSAFAPDGPPRCSGLDIVRYGTQALCDELGPDFSLLESRREAHRTPMGTMQQFGYYRFLRTA
jgi:SAM-dependent methyltransferase